MITALRVDFVASDSEEAAYADQGNSYLILCGVESAGGGPVVGLTLTGKTSTGVIVNASEVFTGAVNLVLVPAAPGLAE